MRNRCQYRLDENHDKYYRPFNLVADLGNGNIAKLSIVFEFYSHIYSTFTLAHGWMELYAGGKRRLKTKVVGIAYLHPDHEEELDGLTGIRKSFESLVNSCVGVEKNRKEIRTKFWQAFFEALEN